MYNGKKTNEHASEYDISVTYPFSVVTISKPKKKWINAHDLEIVKTNTCIPVNALCMYMYTILLDMQSGIFSKSGDTSKIQGYLLMKT
jgi:hypothetical protein